MKIQFLGTSSGSPSVFRNVSATAIGFDKSKEWLLVDCGEGSQHQVLKSQYTAYHLGTICITHTHGDHCYGLPGLLASMSMSGRKAAVNLVAPKQVIEFVHNAIQLTDLSLGFDLHTHIIEALNNKLDFDDFAIEIIKLQHRVPSYGFKITEKCIPNKLRFNKLTQQGIPSGPHFNQLQRGFDVNFSGKLLSAKEYTYPSWRPRVIIVCGDNEKPALLKPYIVGVDVVVHEATFTQSDLHKVGIHTGHSDAKRVAEFAQQCQIPLLVLFHFSVRYHGVGQLDKLRQEAATYYDGQLLLAEDFESVSVAKHFSQQ
ncbi:ribonuclease Z [Pseudoalteromonas sp. MMG012]|uniref:ribonuclease Z n=1 Tax=Pseudoalteromonas sp. MMG012 TaxID=2822686 RepID=UPI001B3A3E6D|nr:ribonuclease Z [Pseudoalteromonas sp. MMG012]MBQ4849674.1 ribonuclease Z [Pseudoalteromonas sp. MMG012]